MEVKKTPEKREKLLQFTGLFVFCWLSASLAVFAQLEFFRSVDFITLRNVVKHATH